MQFSHPVFFYIALALIPFELGWGVWMYWTRRRDVQAFGDRALVASLMQHHSPTRRRLLLAALGLGAWLLVFSMAGPQLGAKMVEVRRKGLDVIIALDVSRSMLAEDIKPTRLQRAQQELTALIDRLGGDRVGIIAFAGSAMVACPLTTDYSAAKMFLNYLAPEMVPVPGTAVGAAIRLATQTFIPGSEGFRILVLLTDGEDHDSQVAEAARAAKAAGIRIVSIGFGTTTGEPIPIRNEYGDVQSYMKDANGKTVVSRLDEATLKEITRITEGAYLPAQQGSLEAEAIAHFIAQSEKREISGGQFGTQEDRYQYVLFPALLLLLLGLGLPERRGAWWLLLVVMAAGVLPAYAGPAEDVNQGNHRYRQKNYSAALEKYRDAQIAAPDDPRVHYDLGNALHQLGKYPEAEQAYRQALKTKDRPLQARTWYNLGNTYFQKQKYSEAIASYRQALKAKPRDEDTVYNLGLALAQKKKQAPQSEKSKADQQKKSDSPQPQSKGEEKQSSSSQNQDPSQTQSRPGEQPRESGPDDRGEAKAGDEAKEQSSSTSPQTLPRPGEMSRENAESILDAVREAEQEAQRKRLQELNRQHRPRGKADW